MRPATSVRRSPKSRDERTDEPALHDRRRHTDGRQARGRHGQAVPAVPVARVEHEDVLQRLVREVVEKVDSGESQQLTDVSAEAAAHPIGFARRHENAVAALGRQRLGQDEQAVHRVRQAEPAATQNGRRGPAALSTPPSAGPTMKPMPKAAPMRPNDFARPSRARDVGDVRKRRGECSPTVTPEITRPDEQPPERRRQRHQDVVEAEAEVRHQHDGPAAEAIGERAEHRRREELHRGPHRAEDRQSCGPRAPCRRRERSRSASAAPE